MAYKRSSRMQSKLLGLLLCAALLGCAPDREAEADVSPIVGTPVEIESVPEVSVGEVEGADVEELDAVGAPALLPDGSIVVPLQNAGEIRIFGPDGEYVRTHGGRGGGPGEFEYLSGVWVRGDTIEAWDGSPPRITRFLPDGGIETIHLRYEGSLLSSLVGGLSDGWLINSVASAGYGQRDEMVVQRFGRDGAHVGNEIAATLGMERALLGNWGGPLPLSPAARFAFHNDGGREELYVAETLTPRIDVFDPSGTLNRAITWEPPEVWDPAEAFDRIQRVVEEGRAEAVGPIPYPPEWARLASPPDEVPVFSDFMVDEEGFIWIQRFEPERDAAALGGNVGAGRARPGGEWMILSPEGRRVGSVEVPAGLAPYQITSDKVVGVYRDELGVEFVRVHSLTRLLIPGEARRSAPSSFVHHACWNGSVMIASAVAPSANITCSSG